jgi:cytochrome c oxidase subunit 2
MTLLACSGPQSALLARGPAAARIAGLWWLLLGVATVVYLAVLAVLAGVVVRRRRNQEERATTVAVTENPRNRWLLGGSAVLSALVLAAAFTVMLRTHHALDPEARADLTVRVVGHRWWWEFRYQGQRPSDEIVTANELHIPTGRRVRLELTSVDVIHSWWVPNLQGKVDLVPGKTSITWLQADEPGVSRGQCAEYCGLQHARMSLLVVAEPPAEFGRWLALQRQPAAEPADDVSRRGRTIFQSSGCGYCHAVRGTPTLGLLAPDLTHLASRRTIAAATLANVRGNLAGWVADPQGLKPGNMMPRVPLGSADLLAVVAYLETLR